MSLDQNLIFGLNKIFGKSDFSLAQMQAQLKELTSSSDMSSLTQAPAFLYELAKINTEAAFILWQQHQQQKLSQWCAKHTTEKNAQISVSKLMPDLLFEKIILLKAGKGYVLGKNHLVIEKPLAFRLLRWIEIKDLAQPSFTYSQSELDELLKDEVLSIAAIIAGAKAKSYKLASEYSAVRSQGGRVIKNWSSIQMLLSELFLSIKTDASLLKDLTHSSAFFILKEADQFVSQNMQVLGGAGYTEDYMVERLYRECIFLKNWPRPYRQELMNHYQQIGSE